MINNTEGGKDRNVYDKHGIPIEKGDIVKVFHFVGPRGKRFYMYKQCLGLKSFKNNSAEYLFFSHLNFIDDIGERDGPYSQAFGTHLEDYEIIQSIGADFNNRPRKVLADD